MATIGSSKMFGVRRFIINFGVPLLAVVLCSAAPAQDLQTDEEFGPVVRAYLGYLRDEQEVVDDRASRHEITRQYYRRNSNRIRALRQIAINIARETQNDYLPELEAATRDELKTLFDKPPNPRSIRVGQVLNNMFRYLGIVRTGETFYIFARLDPYEQAELMEREKNAKQSSESTPASEAPTSEGAKSTVSGRRHDAGTP